MAEEYTVALSKVIEEMNLEIIYTPKDPAEISVGLARVNRPGLPFAGFYDHYERERIQIIGKTERLYLDQLPVKEKEERLKTFFATCPCAIVLTTSLEASDYGVNLAKEYGVPLLRTSVASSEFMANLIAFLNVQLAPRVTRHGVLVEVYGEGVLLLGDSGIGKSETAIELIKRGHRLIADDAVEIKRVSAKSLVGQAPDLIRHYVELRGIGIVDIRRLFGMGAVKQSEKIDLIINLEQWQQGKMYDRTGIEEQTTEILGIHVPSIDIPVRPGRNLAIIIEIAAMNNRQKKMGLNAAQEFNKRLMESMGYPQEI